MDLFNLHGGSFVFETLLNTRPYLQWMGPNDQRAEAQRLFDSYTQELTVGFNSSYETKPLNKNLWMSVIRDCSISLITDNKDSISSFTDSRVLTALFTKTALFHEIGLSGLGERDISWWKCSFSSKSYFQGLWPIDAGLEALITLWSEALMIKRYLFQDSRIISETTITLFHGSVRFLDVFKTSKSFKELLVCCYSQELVNVCDSITQETAQSLWIITWHKMRCVQNI